MLIELKDGGLLVAKGVLAEVTTTDKRLVALVSNENIDSDGDIIHQGKNKRGMGWDLARFNKAPVLTWGHDISRPNIAGPATRAKVGSIEGGGRGLFLDPFEFDSGDEFAQGIAGKYQRGVLKETSVGFIGRSWDKRMVDDAMAGREYFEQELIEVAAVNRGANPDTATMVKMLGAHGLSAKVQGGGDSEIADLKRELADLRADFEKDITMLANVVKRFSDKETAGQEAAVVVSSAANKAASDMDAAAMAILLRLKQIGTAN